MASFTKVNDFVVNMANAMDLDSDTLKVALSNTDPTSGTDVTGDGNGIFGEHHRGQLYQLVHTHTGERDIDADIRHIQAVSG